ncbi:hypothetical protein [Chryseobacterium nematophagum]|nr:hypothetical protein [Chryseobacterium nematophagum]
MPKITEVFSSMISKGKTVQFYIEEVEPKNLNDVFAYYGTVLI